MATPKNETVIRHAETEAELTECLRQLKLFDEAYPERHGRSEGVAMRGKDDLLVYCYRTPTRRVADVQQ